MKPLALSLLAFVAFMAILIIAAVLYTRPTSSPPSDPMQAVRSLAAAKIQQGFKETGCPKCTVYADGTKLDITHPDLAPRAVATALFANKKTVETLKKAGFKTVSIDQGGGAFSYKIE